MRKNFSVQFWSERKTHKQKIFFFGFGKEKRKSIFSVSILIVFHRLNYIYFVDCIFAQVPFEEIDVLTMSLYDFFVCLFVVNLQKDILLGELKFSEFIYCIGFGWKCWHWCLQDLLLFLILISALRHNHFSIIIFPGVEKSKSSWPSTKNVQISRLLNDNGLSGPLSSSRNSKVFAMVHCHKISDLLPTLCHHYLVHSLNLWEYYEEVKLAHISK